jgi:DNA-binding beta-propeller fold protein YncE
VSWRIKVFWRKTICILLAAGGLLLVRETWRSGSLEANGDKPILQLVAEVPLPGPAVRFDYQSFDPTDGRLYIAHMNADHLVVFDTVKRQVVANLDGFHRVHGVISVPELDRVYASVTGDHQVAAVDRKTLQTIARAGEIQYPDGLAYAPKVRRVFVSDEHGNADAVIDTASNTLVKKIALPGGAGNTVYDEGSGRILVAVHEANILAVIDPEKMEMVGKIELPGIQDPHGIALDEKEGLGFIAGEGNNQMAVVDLRTMRMSAKLPVGRDPDVLAWDPSAKRLYVSAESGEVAVFRESDRTLIPEGRMDIPHGHTVSVDPKTHLIYFPLENVKGKAVLWIMEWNGEPAPPK